MKTAKSWLQPSSLLCYGLYGILNLIVEVTGSSYEMILEDDGGALIHHQRNESAVIRMEEYPVIWVLSHAVIAVLKTVACLAAFLFVIAILSSKMTRNIDSYNIYMVFLVIPDALYNGVSLFQNTYTMNDGQIPMMVCQFSQAFGLFYYFSNFWLNAVIAHEIFVMVSGSKRRIQPEPPSVRKVCLQSTFIYTLCAAISICMSIDAPWSLSTIDNEDGYCSYVAGSPAKDDGTFGWLSEEIAQGLLYPFFYIPWMYTLYIFCRIYGSKLLPTSGRTRVLSGYFMRICLYILVVSYRFSQ